MSTLKKEVALLNKTVQNLSLAFANLVAELGGNQAAVTTEAKSVATTEEPPKKKNNRITNAISEALAKDLQARMYTDKFLAEKYGVPVYVVQSKRCRMGLANFKRPNRKKA